MFMKVLLFVEIEQILGLVFQLLAIQLLFKEFLLQVETILQLEHILWEAMNTIP